MARHTDQRTGRTRVSPARRIRAALPVVGICLLLIGAAVLGLWWWHLRSATDPIDAHPVDAHAEVVSSPPCSQGGQTTIRISGPAAPVTATLSGCGFTDGQPVAVQYLAGHPTTVRLAGTTTAGQSGLAGKLLPIGILAAGLVAVLAAIALMVERRRSRHLAAANRISVADLRSRSDSPSDSAAQAVTGTPPEPPDGPQTGVDAEPDSDQPAGTTAAAVAAVGEDAGADDDAAGDHGPAGDRPEPDESAHVLPSGFVIVDEQLFTHSGTEAPSDADRRT